MSLPESIFFLIEKKYNKRKKQKFKILIIAALLMGMVLSFFIYLAIESTIRNQESRNEFLTAEIDKLNRDLVEIKKLREAKTDFLARKEKVVKIAFDKDVVLPSEFTTTAPARIALDFANTTMNLPQPSLEYADTLLNQI